MGTTILERLEGNVGVSGGDRERFSDAQKGERASASLGNAARLASTVSPSQTATPAIEAKKKRYRLQTLARKLLPDERIRTCHRDTIPTKNSVDIVYNLESHTAGFRNLQTCNSVWACPVCAAKISEQRRHELQIATANAPYKIVMLTYTLRHHKHNTLAQSLGALKRAKNLFKSGRWFQNLKDDYGWSGSIANIEPTWSERNGWHPHSHEIVLLPKNISETDLSAFELRCKVRWLQCLTLAGFTGEYDVALDLQTSDTLIYEYISKWGHEPAGVHWSVEQEVTKSVTKKASADGLTPWQLLEMYGAGNAQAGALFVEYYTAFRGTPQLRYSPGTREKLGLTEPEKTDDELAEMPEPGDPMVELTYEQWKYILKEDRRGELIEVASQDDLGFLEFWFAAIGLPMQKITIDFREWNHPPAKPPLNGGKPVFGSGTRYG